eukprot:g19315.t1
MALEAPGLEAHHSPAANRLQPAPRFEGHTATKTRHHPQKGLASAAASRWHQVCVESQLSCHLDVALEQLTWADQLQLLLRSHALVAYHGSGVGAALFWLPFGAVVLEFMPFGCWWCAFAVDAAQPNCSGGSAVSAVTWLMSTTSEAPRAKIPGASHPLMGCQHEDTRPGRSAFELFGQRRDRSRRISLRGFRVLRQTLRRGARAALSMRDVYPACGGPLLEVKVPLMRSKWGNPAHATRALREMDSKALVALDEMWEAKVEVNVFHVSAAVAACRKECHSEGGALDMLESCGRQGLRLDVVTFNSLLQALRASAKGSWKAVLQILFSMPGRALLPTDKTRSTAIGACACNQSKVACNTLITSCGRAFQWRRSLQVVYEMVRMQPDLVTVDAVVTSCTTGSHWGRALQLPEALCQQPDVVLVIPAFGLRTCCSPCDSCVKYPMKSLFWRPWMHVDEADSGSWRWHCLRHPGVVGFASLSQAILLQLGQSRCFEMNHDLFTINFSATTLACEKSSRWTVAVDLLHGRGHGTRRSLLRVGSVIGACENAFQWHRALALLNDMWLFQLQANVMTCNGALSACAAARRWVRALQTYALTAGRRMRPSVVTGSALLSTLEKGDSWRSALRTGGNMNRKCDRPTTAEISCG